MHIKLIIQFTISLKEKNNCLGLWVIYFIILENYAEIWSLTIGPNNNNEELIVISSS
jgi:hypothetical protein